VYRVVKICASCHEVMPGGFRCDFCGGDLVHVSEPGAKELPETVWRQQRVDYGARRGMIVRFLGIISGAVTALYGVRSAVPLPSPWSWIGAAGALVAGLVVWRLIYHLAGRGVRIWVLRKGQLHKRKLARAMVAKAQR
jgi:hypothetical protein